MADEEEFEEVTIESATQQNTWRMPPSLLKSVKLQLVHIKGHTVDLRMGKLALSDKPTIADQLLSALRNRMKYVHMCYEIPERPGSFIICGSNRAYVTDFAENVLLKKFDSQTFIFAQVWGKFTIVLNRTGKIHALDGQRKVVHKLALNTFIDAPCQVVTTQDRIFVKLDDGVREVRIEKKGFLTEDHVIADVIADFVYDHEANTLYFLGRQTGNLYRKETQYPLVLEPRIRKNSTFLKLKISYSGNLIAVQKFSTKLSLHLVQKPQLKQLDSACFEDQGVGAVEAVRLLCPRHGFFMFLVQLGFVLSLFAEHKSKILYVDKVNNNHSINSLAYHKSGRWIGVAASEHLLLFEVDFPDALKL